MKEFPQPGQRYRHWKKDSIYVVFFLSGSASKHFQGTCVTYHLEGLPPTPENLWTRSLAEFLGDHETGPKRFTRIDDSAAGHIYDPNGDGWG